MGPKKCLSDKEEKRLVDYINLAHSTGQGILKCELQNQLVEFVDVNNMQDRFISGSPSKCFFFSSSYLKNYSCLKEM